MTNHTDTTQPAPEDCSCCAASCCQGADEGACPCGPGCSCPDCDCDKGCACD